MLLAQALVGTPVRAQDWATRDICFPATIDVFEAAFAPSSGAEVAAAAAGIANPTGRLWRIETPGGAVSHLWGTYHSAHPAVLDLPQETLNLLASARLLALEIDPISPSRKAYADGRSATDWYRNGRGDPDLANSDFPENVLDWIRIRTEALGWGRGAPETLTTGALAELLLSDPCDDFSAGILPVQDGRIHMLALISGVEVMALEQTRRIKTYLDAPQQRAFALDFLKIYGSYLNPGATAEQRATGIALYRQGRVGEMMAWDRAYSAGILGDGGAAHDRVNGYILDARNVAFVQAAQSELQRGGIFIAVGAFHLPGKQGMIALMRDAGFTVTRVPLPGEVP